jgi:hypothetical protein
LNTDNDNPFINSMPDDDFIGDGVLVNASSILPNSGFLEDACLNDGTPDFEPKRQGRRLRLFDADGDFDLDIVIANGLDGSGAPNVLLINDILRPNPGGSPTLGVFNFIDETELRLPVISAFCTVPPGQTPTQALVGVPDNTYDVAFGDFDGDGDNDLIFANQSTMISPGFRYLINGETDFDGDGMLDFAEDLNGNGIFDPPGTFFDFPPVGIDFGSGTFPRFLGRRPRALITGDFDGDGDLDVYVCMADGPDALLINNPDNAFAQGILVDRSSQISADTGSFASNGGRAADIDNDGDLDILIAKGTSDSSPRPIQFLLNDGQANFTDVSHEFPIPFSVALAGAQTGGNASDLEVLDFDGDGDLDVWVATAGRNENQQLSGALDVFYENRLIGDGYHRATSGNQGPPPPFALMAFPGWALQGQTTTFDLIGYSFDPSAEVTITGGVSVTNVQFIDSEKLVVTAHIPESAETGPRQIRVTNMNTGLGTTSASGIFYVGAPPANEVVGGRWAGYR